MFSNPAPVARCSALKIAPAVARFGCRASPCMATTPTIHSDAAPHRKLAPCRLPLLLLHVSPHSKCVANKKRPPRYSCAALTMTTLSPLRAAWFSSKYLRVPPVYISMAMPCTRSHMNRTSSDHSYTRWLSIVFRLHGQSDP